MKSWYQSNRAALAGILVCLLFTIIEVLELLSGGAHGDDLASPLGRCARFLASQWADPPSLVHAGSDYASLVWLLLVWGHLVLASAFAALLWIQSRMPRPGRVGAVLTALQIAIAVTQMSSLLYIMAAQLGARLPLRQGLAWLGLQTVLDGAVYLSQTLSDTLAMGDQKIHMLWMFGALGLLFKALVFGAAHLVVREARARRALSAANASLQATQSMLADTVRASERMRIARDLHDAVGHHLTALNLHLDLALRQSGDSSPEALGTSRDLARSLLAEVRGVVSSERGMRQIDLQAALATLCSGVPAPALRLHYDEKISIDSPALAHALFFCAQEALTNAMRHAHATLITVDVSKSDSAVLLEVGDDGGGTGASPEGNGLRGMRERVAALGGSLRLDSVTGVGTRLAIHLPLTGAAA